jgi:hypothetical protein
MFQQNEFSEYIHWEMMGAVPFLQRGVQTEL